MTERAARLRTVGERVRRLWPQPVGDERGSAGVELGIGAVIVIGIAAIAVDLYALAKVDAASGQMAVTMANYVSREQSPDGDAMVDLGRYLYEHELDTPAHLVFVVSVVQQPANGNPATVVWDDDTLRFGDPGTTTRLVAECRNRGGNGWRQTLIGQGGSTPQVTLRNDTVAIVVEVCTELAREGSLTGQFVSGNIYRLHVVPVRHKAQRPPATPVYSSLPRGLAGPTRLASGPAPLAVTAGVS